MLYTELKKNAGWAGMFLVISIWKLILEKEVNSDAKLE